MFSAKGIGNKGKSIHDFIGSREGNLPPVTAILKVPKLIYNYFWGLLESMYMIYSSGNIIFLILYILHHLFSLSVLVHVSLKPTFLKNTVCSDW